MYDMIGKNTGPGTILETVVRQNGILVIADLGNFNTDGNMLKPEHKDWLDAKLIPVLKANGWHVKLSGMASKSGDPHYNRNLSLSRVLHVKAYLSANGIPESKIPGPEIRSLGADFSTSNSKDDPDDRTVRITLAVGIRSRPIVRRDPGGVGLGLPVPEYLTQKPWFELKMREPPDRTSPPDLLFPELMEAGRALASLRGPSRPAAPRSPFSQEFMIKQLGESDISVFKIFGFAAMAFRIVDVTNLRYMECELQSPQFGVGSPFSISLQGPYNPFHTKKPVQLSDFRGGAVFECGPGAGPFTVCKIRFLNVPDSSGDTSTISVPMDTGFTFGINAFSFVLGGLRCSPLAQWYP